MVFLLFTLISIYGSLNNTMELLERVYTFTETDPPPPPDDAPPSAEAPDAEEPPAVDVHGTSWTDGAGLTSI